MPNVTVKYSGKFSPYNANVNYTATDLNFNLSKDWKQIDSSIKKGLIQSLLIKVYSNKYNNLKKRKTISLDLYDSFTKNLHQAVAKTESDPILEHHFNLINNEFLNGIIEQPNLIWGKDATRQLGVYSYQDDTIRISSIFNNPDDNEAMYLLRFVIYHEMLHKKFKYKTTNTRSHHHTKEFRLKELEYGDIKLLDERLGKYIRSYKMRKSWAKRKGKLKEFTDFFTKRRIIKEVNSLSMNSPNNKMYNSLILENPKIEKTTPLESLQEEIQREIYSRPKNKQFSLKKWLFGRI